MTTPRRLAAYIMSFLAGYGIPLVAIAAVQDGTDADKTAFHSSSRVLAYQVDVSQDELEALRAKLWALTEHGGTEDCTAEVLASSCGDVMVFDSTK